MPSGAGGKVGVLGNTATLSPQFVARTQYLGLGAWWRAGGWVDVPTGDLGLAPDSPYQVEDLLTGEVFNWRGARNFITLDPLQRVAHILRMKQ